MTIFQLLLFIATVAVFILFFKQLFSGELPTTQIDIETTKDESDITKTKHFDNQIVNGMPQVPRVQQLVAMANEAIEKQDFAEANKALSSALIL